MSTINFYSTKGPYGFLSNFYPAAIIISGDSFPTTEHYFQAMKYDRTPRYHAIRQAATPKIAAAMGRDRSYPLRSDWEQVKDGIMFDAVMQKFTQHENLRRQLLETGDAQLVEHTVNDRYWGDGGNGSGKNMLGKILMEVREKLNEHNC